MVSWLDQVLTGRLPWSLISHTADHWEIWFPHPCERLLFCVKTETALGLQPTQLTRKEDLKTMFKISNVLCSFVLFKIAIISFGFLFFFPPPHLFFPAGIRENWQHFYTQFWIWELLLYHYLTRNLLLQTSPWVSFNQVQLPPLEIACKLSGLVLLKTEIDAISKLELPGYKSRVWPLMSLSWHGVTEHMIYQDSLYICISPRADVRYYRSQGTLPQLWSQGCESRSLHQSHLLSSTCAEA